MDREAEVKEILMNSEEVDGYGLTSETANIIVERWLNAGGSMRDGDAVELAEWIYDDPRVWDDQ